MIFGGGAGSKSTVCHWVAEPKAIGSAKSLLQSQHIFALFAYASGPVAQKLRSGSKSRSGIPAKKRVTIAPRSGSLKQELNSDQEACDYSFLCSPLCIA